MIKLFLQKHSKLNFFSKLEKTVSLLSIFLPDMAFGLTASSRLGCQIIISKEMEGSNVRLPAATRNFYVDGHIPQPH